MEIRIISERLNTVGVVYICEDFEEVAIRLVDEENEIIAYVKRKGRREFLSRPSEKFVYDVELEGREMTKEEYDNY